jgi:hypothetical protein
MWDLCWTKWEWESFSQQSFNFSVNIIPPLLHIHSCVMEPLEAQFHRDLVSPHHINK